VHEGNADATAYEMEAHPFTGSASKMDTEIAQDSPIEGDMAMEKVEKVVDMVDMHKDVKITLDVKTKETNGMRHMKIMRMKELNEDKFNNKMSG
jgi:activator of HSP90 ATPase